MPFQNNTNVSVGPEERRENILNIQPVIAISINDNWGAGVSGVILHLEKGSPWVYGVLVNNIWSLSDEKQGDSYSNGLIHPFLNYNFKGGLYLTSAPIATVDWQADGGDKWVVPIGGGVGKIFHRG